MKNLKKNIVLVLSVLFLLSFVVACGDKTPEPVTRDKQRPAIDLSSVQTSVFINESTVIKVNASDNVTSNENLVWSMTVKKDGTDVTGSVYNATTRAFTPTVIGDYKFTLTVTDEAGNYITREFVIYAELNVWSNKDYTFKTAAATPATTGDFDLFTVGLNSLELKRGYEKIAQNRPGVMNNRKFDIINASDESAVELSGNFFIELKYKDIDSDQNKESSKIALEFTRKGTTTLDEVSVLNNSTNYQYYSTISGIGSSSTGVNVAHPKNDAERALFNTIKIGRFVDANANSCTYVYYHNNLPAAFQNVGSNYGDTVTLKMYSYKSMGTIKDLRMGEFTDKAAPTLSAKTDFPTTASNNDKINLGLLNVEDNIVPVQYINIAYDLRDKDNQAVEVDFNRTFRATKAGNYSVKIKAVDLNGNASPEISKTISVSDTLAPVAKFDGAVTAAIIGQNTEVRPKITDNYVGNINVTHKVTKGGSVTADAAVTVNNGIYTFKATAAGEYNLELTMTDSSGNTGAAAHTITVVAADTVAPVIYIEQPGQIQSQMITLMYFSAFDNVTQQSALTITSRMIKGGTIGADGVVTGGTVLAATGTPSGSLMNLVNNRNLQWSNNWYNPATREFATYSRTGTQSAGDYQLEVKATDEAGNVSTSAITINVSNVVNAYDIQSDMPWGWETFHTLDKLNGVVLGKDSVMIPARNGSGNTTENPAFVPYIRKYLPISEVMEGDFDFEMFYEDITPGITTEDVNVRFNLLYASDAENTMGRQTDVIAFGARTNQQWLEIAIGGGAWVNGPQKIKMSGRNYFKIERRIFNGAAYYRYFASPVGDTSTTDAERIANAVCLNPAGQNVGAAYKNYLVGINFFGHKAGGNFTDIRFIQK